MSDPNSAVPYVESIWSKVPVWLQRANGRKFLVSMILLADQGVKTLLEAFYARMPGLGTPTALPYIGRDRGMIRGMSDTDQTWGVKLITWLSRWQESGSQLAVARAIQDYCAGTPKVKVVNRRGRMTTLNSDGTHSYQDVTWDWDSLSHPPRAIIPGVQNGFWSETWIIVYAPPWPIAGPLNTNVPTDGGLGMKSPRVDVDAIVGLTAQWKSAHTYVRAILWAYDSTLFDPTTPSTMPDGTWGSWSYGSIHCQLSGRGTLEQSNRLRTWEPEREPPENFRVFDVARSSVTSGAQ